MHSEELKEFLIKIERLQSIMITVATRNSNIYEEEHYAELYQEVELSIEVMQENGLVISNPNPFSSLTKLYEYCLSHLNGSAWRHQRIRYIYEIYLNLFGQIEEFLSRQQLEILPSNDISTFTISQIEETQKRISQLQAIMIEVATKKARVQDEEELYVQIYQDTNLKINHLKLLNLSIKNPNIFRSLWHLQAYFYTEVDLETSASRKQYVLELYANVVSILKKVLQKYRLKATSQNKLFQESKLYFTKEQPTPSYNFEFTSQIEDIKALNNSPTQGVSSNTDTHNVQFGFIDKLPEKKFSPIFITDSDISSTSAETITDVLILTALQKEQDAVLRYLDSPRKVQTSSQTFYRAALKTQKIDTVYQLVILCLPSMGNLQAAVITQRAITQFNPSHIILAGIAGGVQKQSSRYLGDIIVGEQIVYYELGKQTQHEQGGSEIKRRYEVYRPGKVLLEAAKSLPIQNWVMSVKTSRPDGTTGRVIPQVHFGVVASGEKVITDPSLINELQSDWSKLVGIEMEGAGVALAAYESNFLPGFFLVKGMCDWADGSKNDAWQEYAADAAAAFVMELLKSAPFESKLRLEPLNSQKPLQSVEKVNKRSLGQIKMIICQRLVHDWQELADYFDIPPHQRAVFNRGREPQGVWEWLEQRNKLSELKTALEVIGRNDLIKELNQ